MAHNVQNATFYSITSSQKGLSGIDLGNFLIKSVVDDLKRHLPSLQHFNTLSPIPGFRNWLNVRISRHLEKIENDELFFELLDLPRLTGLFGTMDKYQVLVKLSVSV